LLLATSIDAGIPEISVSFQWVLQPENTDTWTLQSEDDTNWSKAA